MSVLGRTNRATKLVVNQDPDVPLRVSLSEAKLATSQKSEALKVKNFERFSRASQVINMKAELERQDKMKRLQK